MSLASHAPDLRSGAPWLLVSIPITFSIHLFVDCAVCASLTLVAGQPSQWPFRIDTAEVCNKARRPVLDAVQGPESLRMG